MARDGTGIHDHRVPSNWRPVIRIIVTMAVLVACPRVVNRIVPPATNISQHDDSQILLQRSIDCLLVLIAAASNYDWIRIQWLWYFQGYCPLSNYLSYFTTIVYFGQKVKKGVNVLPSFCNAVKMQQKVVYQ